MISSAKICLNRISDLLSAMMIVACLFCASCSQQPADKFYPELDAASPFGMDWSFDNIEIEDISQQAEAHCNMISGMLNETDRAVTDVPLSRLSRCLETSNYEIYLTDPVPLGDVPNFDRASLSLIAVDPGEPIAITYHYGHSLSGITSETKDRETHANKLRRQLKARYGNPVSRGAFSEYSALGYSKSLLPPRPCDFWVVENVGVFLCAQRLIYIDGIEMSLSYIRLDRAEFGKDLFLEIADKRRNRTEHQAILSQENVIQFPKKPSLDDIQFDKLMSGNWLDSSRFEKCEKPNLLELKDRIALVQDLKPVFAETLDAFQGQALAMYYFENQEALDDLGTEGRSDEVSIFFMSEAEKMGSPAAMNEYGAAQLYCYFGVKQDIKAALNWLQKAADEGDIHAKFSLAKMHLAGLTSTDDARAQAQKLLASCGDDLDGRCGDLKRRLMEYGAPE